MPKIRRSFPKKEVCSENANGVSASGRRLSESEVRRIFACVKEGRVPTGDIAFNIIKTTDKKLMLSPPSFEFGDGIYVFIRNMSGSNNVAVPSNLQHLVKSLNDRLESSMECKWSLSGPGTKTKKKGALQQRYSYPRGRPEYSNTKGGSMWTMIDSTGNDGHDIRVFHVYHSLKRLSSGSGSGGSSDWSSSSSIHQMRSAMKPQPLKKRIKRAEDERAAQVKPKPLKKRIKMAEDERVANMAELEDDTIDALMQEQICSPSVTSFDLDTTLNITEANVFGEGGVDKGYSFMPIPSSSSALTGSNLEPVSAKSLYRPVPAFINNNGMPPLPYSYDTSSQHNPSIGRPLSLLAFSNKLNQLQDCIFNDISATQSTEEQAQKLAVLVHWTKMTAQRPLQSNVFAPVEQGSFVPPPSLPLPPGVGQLPIGSKEDNQSKIEDTDIDMPPRITP